MREFIFRYLDKNYFVDGKREIINTQTNQIAWTILPELIMTFDLNYHKAIQYRDEWRLNYEKTNS